MKLSKLINKEILGLLFIGVLLALGFFDVKYWPWWAQILSLLIVLPLSFALMWKICELEESQKKNQRRTNNVNS